MAEELISHSLWWTSPVCLSKSMAHWPLRNQPQSKNFDTTLEIRSVTSHIISTPEPWTLATRYSSWSKLIQVTAYLMRFIGNCRPGSTETRGSAILLATEYQKVNLFWLKYTQTGLLPSKIQALFSNSPISSTSVLLSLNSCLFSMGKDYSESENDCKRQIFRSIKSIQ